jgi:hypothetical protein
MDRWVITLFLLSSIFAFSNQSLYFNYQFDDPQIIDSGGVQLITIKGLPQTITANEPRVPFKQARILIPFGMRVRGVAIDKAQPRIVEGIDNLAINSLASPISLSGQSQRLQWSDLTFDRLTPAQTSDGTRQSLRGHRLLLLNLFPIQVTPQKEVLFYESISLRVDLEPIAIKAFEPTRSASELTDWVDNPADLASYPLEDVHGFMPQGYDYLILVAPRLAKADGSKYLKNFQDFLESQRGLTSKVFTIAHAESVSLGRDRAEKVRNFVRREYENSNIRYLLLVGDSDSANQEIPVRKLYSEVMGYLFGTWKMVREHINSDFYYGCLDGSFNEDGDNYWGEPTDGPNGEDVDFLCEVTVGRWSANNTEDIRIWVEKTVQGTTQAPANKRALLLGEELFQELNLYGEEYMRQLIGRCDDHGYTTEGYDATWEIDHLFDRDSHWSGAQAARTIARGNFTMVNHLGHSSQGTNMRMSKWSYRGLDNEYPYFFYSQGCFAGDFTSSDSIVEMMLFMGGGPFAAVANSNYGLGPEDPDPESTVTPGTSQILHRMFINNVMKEGSETYMAYGRAHEKSKRDILMYIDHQEARWVTWAATYFGDPAAEIR